jgi:hypothetical protein
MKLIGRTLNYICKTNEEVGMFTEKIVCDILKIKFNSKRDYINEKSHYPFKLKSDIEKSLKPFFTTLDINEHVGHKNDYYDFKTNTNQTVSIKTNMSGNKICPQSIGQVSLNRFNEKTGMTLKASSDYKSLILSDTKRMINLYLQHLFCCDHLVSFKFDKGRVYYFKKENSETVSLNETHNIIFNFSKDLTTWNESMSMGIMINNTFKPLCEFQIHNSRNCIKCRFNLDTVILMIQNNMLKNVSLELFDLKYKYIIKVLKTQYEEMDMMSESVEMMDIEASSVDEPISKKRKSKK